MLLMRRTLDLFALTWMPNASELDQMSASDDADNLQRRGPCLQSLYSRSMHGLQALNWSAMLSNFRANTACNPHERCIMSRNVSLRPGLQHACPGSRAARPHNWQSGRAKRSAIDQRQGALLVKKPANMPITQTETLHTTKEASLTGRRPVDPIAAGAGPRPATMLRDARRAAILSLSCSC